jgi:hypothetical protein
MSEELRRRLTALNTEAALLKDLSAQSSDNSRELRRAANRLVREFRKVGVLLDASVRHLAVRETDVHR